MLTLSLIAKHIKGQCSALQVQPTAGAATICMAHSTDAERACTYEHKHSQCWQQSCGC